MGLGEKTQEEPVVQTLREDGEQGGKAVQVFAAITHVLTTRVLARTTGYQGGNTNGSGTTGMDKPTHTSRKESSYGHNWRSPIVEFRHWRKS